jgi:hypothetical protein
MKKTILIISLISGFAFGNAIAATQSCASDHECVTACQNNTQCVNIVTQVLTACQNNTQCVQSVRNALTNPFTNP